MKRNPALPVLLWLAASGACLIAVTAAYLQGGNTLVRNGHWASSKLSLEGSAPEAIEAFTRPTTLSGARLNLGVFHGFQEFVSAGVGDYRSIDFDFLVPAAGYFTFLFNKDGTGFNGIRISREPSYPSAFITGTSEGEFLETQPLPESVPGNWGHARVELADDQVSFLLNGRQLGSFKISRKKEARFGFRGSHAAVLIDNVSAKDERGATIFEDSFGNRQDFGLLLFLSVLILALLQWILIGTRAGSLEQAIGWGTVVSGMLTVVALRFYVAVPAWVLPQYPDPSRFSGYPEIVELNDLVLASIRARYPIPGHRRRVLFLGNSQTQGAGARYLEDRMVERIERKLGPGFECINGAVIGSKSYTMLENLKSDWLKLEPSLIVMNFSNEGAHTLPKLGPDVEAIVRLARGHGIETLLVLSANEPLSVGKGTETNHQIIREVAAREKVALADLHGALLERRDSGFLWWDRTHLTSYGQKLAAEFLSPLIEKMLHARK